MKLANQALTFGAKTSLLKDADDNGVNVTVGKQGHQVPAKVTMVTIEWRHTSLFRNYQIIKNKHDHRIISSSKFSCVSWFI